MNFSEKLKNMTNRFVAYALVAALVLTGSFSFASSASAVGVSTVVSALGAGVHTISEVADVYKGFNPPQKGYVSVMNGLKDNVTVRSYNNNDWAMIVAAGQINLKPGSDLSITAATDPIKLAWKRGNYGTLKGFGTKFNQSAVPKNTVFVIDESNTL